MSIGQTLAAARESAGLTVDEVSRATRIRRTLILAIENDDFSGCGGDFYARGHLRTIAAKIGLDPKPLLAEFDATRPAPPRASDVFEAETAAPPERRGPNWSAAMAGALVLIVAFGVFQAFNSRGHEPRSTGGPETLGTDDASTSSAPSSPAPSGGGSAVAQAPRGKVTVLVRASERSWVQVTTDTGQELFQGLLDVGQRRSFSDRSGLRLVVGNAGGVALTVNGTDIGAPGRRGQVARLQFTPEDPAAG